MRTKVIITIIAGVIAGFVLTLFNQEGEIIMKIIDLLNKIANGEIEDKTKFRIYFANNMYRDIYYDDEEQNQLNCLKNISDDYPIYDDICLLDEVEIVEEEKKIPEKLEIINEKNCKNNWKWKVKGEEYYYNISTPQKIIADKINQVIDYLESKGE